MQGMVFTEFLKMVDQYYSPEITEKIIQECDSETGGAYTSVGNYSHAELVSMVAALSKIDKTPVQDLVRAFGKFLLGQFAEKYPDFFTNRSDVFDFFDHVGSHVHEEVMRLYPDARPPMISTRQVAVDTIELTYRSHRGLGDAAHGLIEGSLEHFETEAVIERKNISEGAETCVQFMITRNPTAVN